MRLLYGSRMIVKKKLSVKSRVTGALGYKEDGKVVRSRLVVECTQPVELKVRPYQKGGWIIFPLGRSVVLGPRAVVGFQLPYKLRNFSNVIFRDCLMGKPVRVWPKCRFQPARRLPKVIRRTL